MGLLALAGLLSGCFGPPTLDASNEKDMEESIEQIASSLSGGGLTQYEYALLFYSMRGVSDIAEMVDSAISGESPLPGDEDMFAQSLQSLDGLTGPQIIEKYTQDMAQDEIVRAQEKILRVEAEKLKLAQSEELDRANAQDAVQLKRQAQTLRREDRLQEALDVYGRLAELPTGVQIAQMEIDAIMAEMQTRVDEASYAFSVEITHLETIRIPSGAQKGFPAVRMTVKNAGGRFLDTIKVRVYFRDNDGNTLFEQEFTPLLVNKYSTSRFDTSLMPGSVKEMVKDGYWTVDSTLPEWTAGDAVARVSEVKFTPQP